MSASNQDNRNIVRDEARELARMIIDTAGLSHALYAQAGKVYSLTTTKGGNRDKLTIDEQHALFDLMEGQIRRGASQEEAAEYVKGYAKERFKLGSEELHASMCLTNRQLIEIYKKIRDKGQFKPVDESK